jgi:tRNA pseudouridine synthase 10
VVAFDLARRSVYVKGRYRKHGRGLSQSPWIVDGRRLGEFSSSVSGHCWYLVLITLEINMQVEEIVAGGISSHLHSLPAPLAGLAPAGFDASRAIETVPTADTNVFVAPAVKFHSAGREDVDVRMLGRGRPCVIEITNAR